jgi:hypothetical protein
MLEFKAFGKHEDWFTHYDYKACKLMNSCTCILTHKVSSIDLARKFRLSMAFNKKKERICEKIHENLKLSMTIRDRDLPYEI